MKMIKLMFGVVLLLTSAGAADFFPLQQGNTWTYRNSASGASFTVTVGTPIVMNDQVYHTLRGYTDQPLLVRLTETGLVKVDEESGKEQLVTSFQPFEQGWWEAPGRTCPEQEGQTQQARGVYDGATGPIHDVLEIRYRTFSCADVGIEKEQYAENIGMVRRINNSFIGPVTFDLTYARVGNIQIEPASRGSFTITPQYTKGSDITVTLRALTNPNLPLKLQFASGQEFEVVLTDDQGRAVWKWSDGQMFVQATHEITLSGGWSKNIQMPRPQPGNYTLQGWITTASPSPQFAASVPLSIAPLQ